MVMRLNFERDGNAVADVNDAGVFLARADQDFRRLGGERLEQRARVFVAAMLAPHHGEDAQLGVARRAAEDLLRLGVFVRREVVLGNQLWGDGGFGHDLMVKVKIGLQKFPSQMSVLMLCPSCSFRSHAQPEELYQRRNLYSPGFEKSER